MNTLNYRQRRLMVTLFGVGLSLLLAGLTPLLLAQAQEPTPAPPQATAAVSGAGAIFSPSSEAITPTGEDGYCVLCHSHPWNTVTLQDGNLLNLYVPEELVAASIHGTSSSQGELGCLDCHGDSFPHSGPTPQDDRALRLERVSVCFGCHQDQMIELENGRHEEAILAGNREAAVCTDCHSAHDVQRVAAQPELVAGICGDCHIGSLSEWQASPHLNIGPLGCGTCHSPHSQRLRVGPTTTDLCLNCHREMPDIFIHREHSGGETPIECVQCHMFVPTTPDAGASVSASRNVVLMTTGHTMNVETLACNTCHEELVLSGEWEQLRGTGGGQAETVSAEEAAEAEAQARDTFLQLIQGLILGLGFGITGAAIFVTRGNERRASSNE